MRPNFFIVGAPKAGTTALTHYLGQHPEIFIPHGKQLPVFCPDLHFAHRWGKPTEQHEPYLNRFAGARNESRVGETSVWYLYSREAAARIHEFAPDASIIVMLRDPAEMMYAQHSQFLYNGNEDIQNFAAALAAEPDRREGRRVPRSAHMVQGLFYRDTAMYADQLGRYFDTFGQDRVHVVIYDDFRRQTDHEVRRALEFLEVDDHFRPDLKVVNSNKAVRSRRLQNALISPPPRLEAAFRAVTPRSLHGCLVPGLQRLNTVHTVRSPLDSRLASQLRREMRPEVERLADLLGRDLSSWMAA